MDRTIQPAIFVCAVASFVLALLQLATTINGQQCLLASNGSRPLPSFERHSEYGPQSRNPIQAIITSYSFNCCGVITGWGASIGRFGQNFEGNHMISFQVWRPNSPSADSTSCYNLTGANNFDIELEWFEWGHPMRGLINVTTPLDESRITVQPGDVVGFNYIGERNRNGIAFSADDSYREESVWFETGQRVETDRTICPGRRFTNLAPLITATVVPTTCSSHTLKVHRSRVSTIFFSTSAVPTELVSAENLGLTIGAAAGASVLLVVTIFIICIILLCAIIWKRKSSPPVSKIRFARNKQDVHSSSIAKNEAYGKFAQVSQTDNVYDSVYTTQETASTVQGQVYSDSDYYTNEGLVGVADKPDSNPDPSIPTTENQAYTSVSADTERVKIEEIHDGV